MTMVLHVNATPVSYDDLVSLDTPQGTDTHVPVPHCSVVLNAIASVQDNGFDITSQHYGLTKDGARFFGLLNLSSDYPDYNPSLILRNSHDKTFAMALGIGSRVFVCDNLAFFAEHTVKRKHTSRIIDDLEEVIARGTAEVLAAKRDMELTYEQYKSTPFDDQYVDHLLMQMYRDDIVPSTGIAKVHKQWHNPDLDWGSKTAWRLFNAATYTLKGRALDDPRKTNKLHKLITEAC